MTSKSITNKQDTCCIFENILALFGADLRSDKQKAILEASYNLFTEKGYHETTIDDIAYAAKVGKGTIYNYFADKEAILTFLIDNTMRNALKNLNKIDIATPVKAFGEYIRISFESMIDIAPLMMQCLNMNMVIHNKDNQKKLYENIDKVKKILGDILLEGKKQKVFTDQIDVDMPVAYAADNLNNVIRQYLIGLAIANNDHTILRKDLHKHSEKLTNFILYGIAGKQ